MASRRDRLARLARESVPSTGRWRRGGAHKALNDGGTILGIAGRERVCSVLDPSLVVVGGSLLGQGNGIVARVRQIVGRVIPTPPSVVVFGLDKDAPLWSSLLATHGARARLRQQLGHWCDC